jgi:hypothetical protein
MDDQGVAVIMTSREDQDFYADVSLNAEVVESTLQTHLVEGNHHLLASYGCLHHSPPDCVYCTVPVVSAICAEITQNVITSVAECVQWMQSTFFYIRCEPMPLPLLFPSHRIE